MPRLFGSIAKLKPHLSSKKLSTSSEGFHANVVGYNPMQRIHSTPAVKSYNSSPAAASYNMLSAQPSKNYQCNFITEVIDYWAQFPEKPAIRCAQADQNSHISYQSLSHASQSIAAFFQQQSFKTGDSVALMLGQETAWWYSLAGLMRSGIAAVPCPKLLTSGDLAYRFNDLSIRGIITTPEIQDRVDSIKSKCPSLSMTITTGQCQQDSDWLPFSDTLKIPSTGDYQTTIDDPCLYLYTSGTTGDPKAVQHNADYPFYHLPTGERWMQASENDLVYNASDTGWGFTVWTTTAAWAMGAEILITPSKEKFSAEKMLKTLQEERVTIFCAAPTVLRLLAADPVFEKTNLPVLRRIVTVGEALDETVIEKFAKKGVEIAVGFGQAETPLIIGRTDDQKHTPNSMGTPIDPYKVVVLDEEFQPLPPGSTGQIAVDLLNGSSGGIMRKYANSPEKTKNTRSPNNQYHLTGDWAHYREDGELIYEGRRDDLIKSRGYRIGPDEVEKAGMSHPAVAKIAVVGVKNVRHSHQVTVKAFILLKPGYSESKELIQRIQLHIKNETAPHKYPRIIEFLSKAQWEKYETTSGKIRRVALRELEARKMERLDDENEHQHDSPRYKI